jgi:hypothetical protein
MSMNKVFAEYTTATAFAITLTKNHCHILLRVRRSEGRDHYLFHPHQARQLRARGLIAITTKTERAAYEKKHGQTGSCIYKLTNAGVLMCQLLDEAGLSLSNTKTLTTVKAMHFWGMKPEVIAEAA